MISALWGLLLACEAPDPSLPELPPLPPRVGEVVAAPLAAPRPLRQFTLAVTGEVRGEIEPCGCPTVPYGGFERRAAFLDQLRSEDVPLFVLDVGEMLVKASDTDGRLERGRAVLDLALATGLDAWAAAPLDLVPGGLALLQDSHALSATWRKDGAPVLPPSRVVERDGVRLGVIGLSERVPDFEAADPIAAVRAAITPGAADTWVVLANTPPAVAEAVAAAVPELGLVISLRGESRDAPRATAGAPVIETVDQGKWVTVVRAFVAAEPGPLALAEKGEVVATARLTRAAAMAGSEGTRAANVEALAAARARLATSLAGQRWMVVEDQPLGSEFGGSAGIRSRVDRFKRRAVDAAAARVETADAPTYGTAGYCTRCHDDFTARWVGQPHARALEALVTKGAASDPECVGCHTTGWGQPGGYSEPTAKAMMTWKGVQCEACHGPMAAHPNGPATPAAITRETCLRCHDKANSPGFDYERYRAGVSCVQLLADRAAGTLPTPAPVTPTPPLPR